MVKFNDLEQERHQIDNLYMCVGTILVAVAWSMLSASAAGTSHMIPNVRERLYIDRGFLNMFISGSTCSFISFFLKKVIVVQWKQLPKHDIRSLCNGFLSGMAAVAAGAGYMPPYAAAITGLAQAFFYMTACLVLNKLKVDDAMENLPIFGTAFVLCSVSSVLFHPLYGPIGGLDKQGRVIGILMMGFLVTSVLMLFVAWVLFFPLKQCKLLRMRRAVEILGNDVVDAAKYKGLDIEALLQEIQQNYPELKKKGC
mmetsp:Transcript_43475/g.31742  ORF Transcript_43475/g.31742 Transcript_43475/m.31742 type:complete len:255 (-) Transcript_43475:30-794(-)